ncbi:MAG: uracil-DNA glycosylase family protein [Gammaproteobacteria bacterium]|nr:uracil-DNA glycosylase family protein [Gammaproteobacteria bacterium]
MASTKLIALTKEIRACTQCACQLPFKPNPIVRPSNIAKVLIIGQAPGTKVHESSISWNDTSGNTLRDWLGVDREIFYDDTKIAIMPMGFCYPGKGKSGDLPPRPECAPMWHPQLLNLMPQIKLTLLIGMYAQKFYLQDVKKKNLTETVRAWRQYAPYYLPMPHPSPRNKLWLKKNKWFELEVVPVLKKRVKELIF